MSPSAVCPIYYLQNAEPSSQEAGNQSSQEACSLPSHHAGSLPSHEAGSMSSSQEANSLSSSQDGSLSFQHVVKFSMGNSEVVTESCELNNSLLSDLTTIESTNCLVTLAPPSDASDISTVSLDMVKSSLTMPFTSPENNLLPSITAADSGDQLLSSDVVPASDS